MRSLVQEGYDQLKLEEYEKARATFLQALDLRDELENSGLLEYVLTGLDTTWLLTEKFDEGITFFADYISRYPDDSAAYCGRAGALWYSGQLEKAIHDYSRMLELAPSNIMALSGRGQVFAEMGSNEKALDDLDLALRSLKMEPSSDSDWNAIEAFVRRGRGVALAGLGQNESAMDEFNASIKLCPENAWVYHSRAHVYDTVGDHKKASSDYQVALAKKGPALTPIQREHANARMRELLVQG